MPDERELMMNNFKLKTRILLGYLPPLCLFLLLGGIVYSSVVTREKLNEEVKLAETTIVKVDKVVLGLSRMVRNARGQILFPKDASYRTSYDKGVKLFQEASAALEELIQDPKQQERLKRLIAAAKKNLENSEQVFKFVKAGKIAQAKDLVTKVRMSPIDKAHQEILTREIELLAQKTEEEEAAKNSLVLAIVLGTLISAISTIVAGMWLASGITQTISQAASAISSSSSEIAATIEQQERTASQQAASVSETTTTMDEMEASSRQSAQQAEAAATAAGQALQLADGGTKAVEQTLEGMSTLEEKVGAIANQSMRLSEQTTEIGNISQLVSNLAKQTNVLALNAAVEAARAGENGKGFSVVAAEIRKLADQSKQSAEKIKVLVSQIQNEINSTVMVTDEGTKTVKTGVQIAQKTASAFAGVADAVNNVVLNNQQISLNLKQQVDAIQQVVGAMNTINQGAQQTASGISQTRAGTQQLNEAAVDLKGMV